MDVTPNILADVIPNQPSPVEPMSTVRHSPWKSFAEHQNVLQDVFSKSNEHRLSAFSPVKFNILEDPEPEKSPFSFNVPQQQIRGFAVFEQNMQDNFHLRPTQAFSASNAMKTAFQTLNAGKVERGVMDGAKRRHQKRPI